MVHKFMALLIHPAVRKPCCIDITLLCYHLMSGYDLYDFLHSSNFSYLLLYNVNFFLLAGTDDDHDLQPPFVNSRDMRGSSDERANEPVSSHARAQTAMEAQFHQLEHGLLHS